MRRESAWEGKREKQGVRMQREYRKEKNGIREARGQMSRMRGISAPDFINGLGAGFYGLAGSGRAYSEPCTRFHTGRSLQSPPPQAVMKHCLRYSLALVPVYSLNFL